MDAEAFRSTLEAALWEHADGRLVEVHWDGEGFLGRLRISIDFGSRRRTAWLGGTPETIDAATTEDLYRAAPGLLKLILKGPERPPLPTISLPFPIGAED